MRFFKPLLFVGMVAISPAFGQAASPPPCTDVSAACVSKLVAALGQMEQSMQRAEIMQGTAEASRLSQKQQSASDHAALVTTKGYWRKKWPQLCPSGATTAGCSSE